MTEKLAAHIQKLQADKNNADFLNDAIAKQRDEYDGRLKIIEPGFDLLMKNIRTQLDKKFESEKQRYSREWQSIVNSFQWNMEQADKFQNFSQLNSRFDPHLLINHFQSKHDQEDWLSGTIQGSYFYKELITWWLNEYLFQILRATKPQLDEVSREDARKRVQSVIGPLSSDNYEQAKVVKQKLENFYQQLTFEYYAEILKNGQFGI